ncbi:MAG: glycosyltransferase [Candidatus Saccharimonadales bacterium]
MRELLHPELLEHVLRGRYVARRYESLARQIKAKHIGPKEPDVSVVIRTLNEAEGLRALVQDIRAQDYTGKVEIVVVDNESTDGTPELAKELGAKVVTLPRADFTYPRSMNLGVETATYELVWLTVGHALPSSRQVLRAGARWFRDPKVGGVYHVPILPNANASWLEKGFLFASSALFRTVPNVKKAGLGVLAATSAMIAKPIWRELGRFDERYESGGEDTALAGKMIAAGYKVVREPGLAAHHSHGSGLIKALRKHREYLQTVKGPVPLRREEIKNTHPHLNP